MNNSDKTVAIFIPTFDRSHGIHRIVDNINENTKGFPYRIYFIVEHDDYKTQQVVNDINAVMIINSGLPCYADCINTAYQATRESFFFTGADDLGFYEHWLERAMEAMTDSVSVVGTNDMGNIPIGQERDSTHYLIRRTYIEEQSGVIDRPNTVLYPYLHNYTDKEFIETAQSRGVFAYAPESKVEHMHPAWGKAPWDTTYDKGQKTSNQDLQTYLQRRHFWSK